MKDSILDEIRLERNVMAAKAEKKDREMIRKFDNALAWMDAVAQEVRDSRDERELAGQQTVRISNRVANHEKRIVVIEKKVA